MGTSIAVIGEYQPTFEPHAATNASIGHAGASLNLDVDSTWISTADLDESVIRQHQAIWVAPGSPYRNLKRTLAAIRFARENDIPCLGTCGGFQHMILEYARNVLGFADAQHAEYEPQAPNLFISRLACSLAGKEMDLRFTAGSLVARSYASLHARERYYCNCGINPDRASLFTADDLRAVGFDADGAIRAVELLGHPFFVGTLYVPQVRSAPGAPHPLVSAFVFAAAQAVPANA